MPTYDYECLKCEARFERFQQMTDPLVRKCPECGGKVRRLIGAGAGLLFKGSGFHITDYRSKDYHSRAKAEKEPGTSGAKGGSAADSPAASKGTDAAGGAGGSGEGASGTKAAKKPGGKPRGKERRR